MSQTLCLLDSLSSLQVGILHLSCHEPKDSKSQIQLCCCFPELAATAADCKCTQCSQNVAGRFPTVKELEQTASYFPLESLGWLEGSFRPSTSHLYALGFFTNLHLKQIPETLTQSLIHNMPSWDIKWLSFPHHIFLLCVEEKHIIITAIYWILIVHCDEQWVLS